MERHEYLSDFAKKHVAEGREEGRAQGEAHALLTFLAARGFVVDAELQARVRGCTDLGQLDRWIARAAVVRALDEVFEDG